MTTRGQHFHNQKRHDQRNGVEKPKPAPAGTDTAWMTEFVSSIQGITTTFNADAIITWQLGETRDQRVTKLRHLSRLGVLRMYAHRENGQFVEYRWELTQAGRL